MRVFLLWLVMHSVIRWGAATVFWFAALVHPGQVTNDAEAPAESFAARGSVMLVSTAAVLPNPNLTPGAVRTTHVAEICGHGTRALRHWSRARDDHILREYGLPSGAHPDFEIDHSVPLGIGGADDDANLWPQPRSSIEPVWNAEVKDRLEWFLRVHICSGELDVREAQREIATNWIAAYRHYIGAGALE